jgi:NAD(P)-dependent dehydrogenase (short-subunit alcohol dehydrogenase family)
MVVLVTGTSRGIGEGIASLLLERGHRVVGVSRAGSRDVLRLHARFADVRHDLSAPQRVEDVVDQALGAFGTIDALVNNAGTLISAGCHEQTDAELDQMLALNVTAPFRLSQLLARDWVTHGTGGVIVNVCSVEAQVAWPPPGQSGYAVTKAALLGLTRGLALALGGDEIRVVAIGPGVIETDMSISGDLRGLIPLGHRYGTTTDVAELTAFLLSDAARYITGEIVYVDGGYVIQ